MVCDFTDAGMVTSYLEPLQRVKRGMSDLLWNAEAAGAEIAVAMMVTSDVSLVWQ